MTPIKDRISLGRAMWRGFLGKCPNCGKGLLFGRFLKVADHCEQCGEEFHHHRADDFPAYIVIIIVGHAIVPAILAIEIAYAPPAWLQLAIWLPLTLFSSLALLQPTKGRSSASSGKRECTASNGQTSAASRKRPCVSTMRRVQRSGVTIPKTRSAFAIVKAK